MPQLWTLRSLLPSSAPGLGPSAQLPPTTKLLLPPSAWGPEEVTAPGVWAQNKDKASRWRMTENSATGAGPLSGRPLQRPESRPREPAPHAVPRGRFGPREGNQSHRAYRSSSFIWVQGTPHTEAHGLFPWTKRLPGPHGSRSPPVTSSHPQGTVGLGWACLGAGGPQGQLWSQTPVKSVL